MPLKKYGVLAARLVDRRREGSGDTPHYQIHLADDAGTHYRVPGIPGTDPWSVYCHSAQVVQARIRPVPARRRGRHRACPGRPVARR
ncbi:DUF2278 family protein [Streptomyces sp. NPDC058424]|uniref:DUF2278 family protein n=1 Tax=Streptomyces sp. NPDC058424 TaxID=3346491 RepID=UPI00365E7413